MSKKNCANCLVGTALNINNDILCRYKGVVSPDYVCFKHRNQPAQKDLKPAGNKCYDCEFFILDMERANLSEPIGLCRLFSVRKYNGLEKNACSKISRKTEVEVS